MLHENSHSAQEQSCFRAAEIEMDMLRWQRGLIAMFDTF